MFENCYDSASSAQFMRSLLYRPTRWHTLRIEEGVTRAGCVLLLRASASRFDVVFQKVCASPASAASHAAALTRGRVSEAQLAWFADIRRSKSSMSLVCSLAHPLCPHPDVQGWPFPLRRRPLQAEQERCRFDARLTNPGSKH